MARVIDDPSLERPPRFRERPKAFAVYASARSTVFGAGSASRGAPSSIVTGYTFSRLRHIQRVPGFKALPLSSTIII